MFWKKSFTYGHIFLDFFALRVKEIIFSQNGVTKFASRRVIVKGQFFDSSYCTKPRAGFVQVYKMLSATRKNIPYRSLLSEGSFKKMNFGFTFDLSHSLIYGGQNQKPPERRWCPPKKLQLNSCQAKDKPPRPLRSERSRKADGTASSRIACQESTLWQCRQQIQFDVTLFSFHKPLCMRLLSDETHEGE